MIIAVSILSFEDNKYDKLEEVLKQYKNIEIHEKDIDNGKIIISIEAENNKDIENIENDLLKWEFIYQLNHYAFHFGDEVEKVLQGGEIPDFDINKPFTKKRIL